MKPKVPRMPKAQAAAAKEKIEQEIVNGKPANGNGTKYAPRLGLKQVNIRMPDAMAIDLERAVNHLNKGKVHSQITTTSYILDAIGQRILRDLKGKK